jgi:rRNA maturation RNase YbeY
MASVHFFSQDLLFKLPKPRKVSNWIKYTVTSEEAQLQQLNFIFCSDEALLKLNIEYLNHTTLTDIITFNTSDDPAWIEGEIYISIDRVRENAEKLGNAFIDELHRVIIHGVLHLLGYGDKSTAQKKQMRKKEDAYLSLREIN